MIRKREYIKAIERGKRNICTWSGYVWFEVRMLNKWDGKKTTRTTSTITRRRTSSSISIVKIFFQKHQIDFSAIPFEEAPFQFRRIRYIYVMFALAEVIEIMCRRIKFIRIAAGRRGRTRCWYWIYSHRYRNIGHWLRWIVVAAADAAAAH